MIVRIDQSLGVPIYQQVRDQVVAAIAAGELVEGDALPSVRALAVDLGINLHTVNKAYALLRDDGYLVVRGRAGAFVAKPMRTRRRRRTGISRDGKKPGRHGVRRAVGIGSA